MSTTTYCPDRTINVHTIERATAGEADVWTLQTSTTRILRGGDVQAEIITVVLCPSADLIIHADGRIETWEPITDTTPLQTALTAHFDQEA